MSKTTERAVEEVKKTQFMFKSPREIEVLNAFIFWTNFRGEANQFGSEIRSFNLALTDEAAEILAQQGWRVKEVENEDGSVLRFVNVKVNMDSAYPPIVALYSEYRGKRTRRTLDAQSIGELDRVNIESADCLINAYSSKRFEGKVTGYLKKLNVIQEPNVEFGGKYDDWMEGDPNSSDLPFEN